ncbi:hypothetical protein MRB53_011647 [Persea americana]|uniref:Uncharacterized protein n=1 Tax=Persea americana TaxID=3435 RepID=A0ACC2LVI6_PERAE|nr:hypothetical protein MRB53_011647 [Persea americana]
MSFSSTTTALIPSFNHDSDSARTPNQSKITDGSLMNLTKFEKKALRCIFTGYDSKRKCWRCVDLATGRVHVFRNVVFDEASSWWSTDHNALPDSRELELETQEKMNSDVVSEPVIEEPAEKPCLEENPNQADTSSNPWRSSVHQIRNAEEARPSQLDEPENEDNANKLRRSSRTQKPNPRYANCALTTAWGATTDDADSVYEPVSFEEAE